MDAIYIFFCVLVAVLASIAVWSPRQARLRAVAVALVAVFVPVGYLTLTEILSQPKPMTHEWYKRQVDEATLLSMSFDELGEINVDIKLPPQLPGKLPPQRPPPVANPRERAA